MVKMSKSISKSYMNNQNFSDEDEDIDEMDSCPDQSAQDTTSPDEEPNTSQSKKDRPALVPGRFARIDDDEIYKFQEVNQSAATKKNTKWGLKLFQGMLKGLDKQNCSTYNCDYFLTNSFYHMFLVLKRTVSLRRFF